LKAIFFMLATVSAAFAWTCPACGTVFEGEFCPECGLISPPEGMTFIPACSVSVDGNMVHVPAFFIDSEPVSSRSMLSWLSSEITHLDQVHVYLTGQAELLMPGENIGEEFRDVVFVRYTPWVVYRDMQGGVEGITVQTGCFDNPANAVTFDAAGLYLGDNGKRLPTEAELTAAISAGAAGYVDTWDVVSAYSDFISMTLSSIIGVPPAGLAMFSENLDPRERIMWEWTADAWGQQAGAPSDAVSPYAVILKPLDPVVRGTGMREYGYFNVIFRGVVALPWYQGNRS